MVGLARVLAAAGLLAAVFSVGCGRPASVKQPIPPPEIRPAARAPVVERKLDPDPNYEPKDIDALARQLSGISARPAEHSHIYFGRSRSRVFVPHYGVVQTIEQHDRRPSLRGDHYLNTLFWGGLGAVIGHQSGHTERGAIIGAGFGHMMDHGGPHGLFTRDTIFGGVIGAGIGSLSGRSGKGALIGAAAGHLLDDVFRGPGR